MATTRSFLREQILALLGESTTSPQEDFEALWQCVAHIRNRAIVGGIAQECGLTRAFGWQGPAGFASSATAACSRGPRTRSSPSRSRAGSNSSTRQACHRAGACIARGCRTKRSL